MDVDDEVRVRVLEERVHGIGMMTREAEKCCGGLKGDLSRLGERVVVLEHDVNTHCVELRHMVDGLVSQRESDNVTVKTLQADLERLRQRLWWAVTVALGAVIIDLLGLL